jgi:hypothetical protein
MLRILKWILPSAAAFGLVMGSLALRAKAQTAPASAKGSIAGLIKDKDGKPAAGVEVRLLRPGGGRRGGGGGPGGGGPGGPPPRQQNEIDPTQLQAQTPPGGGQQGPPTPVATATTDKDGKFTMKDVAVGMYRVVVRDDGKKLYGTAQVTVEDGKTASVEVSCTDTPPQRGGGGGNRRGGGGGGGAGGPPPQQ